MIIREVTLFTIKFFEFNALFAAIVYTSSRAINPMDEDKTYIWINMFSNEHGDDFVCNFVSTSYDGFSFRSNLYKSFPFPLFSYTSTTYLFEGSYFFRHDSLMPDDSFTLLAKIPLNTFDL